MSYEKPNITSVSGYELMEALGPAQAISSGGIGVTPSKTAPEAILTGSGGKFGR